MASKALVVRDFDAAHHDRAFAGKSVHVEAKAGTRNELGAQPLFGAGEIPDQGEFVQSLVAFNANDANKSGPSKRRIIRKALGRLGLMRLQYALKVKRLRRLYPVEMGTIDSVAEMLAFAAHERIGRGQSRHGGRVGRQRLQKPVDHLGGTEGAGGVMDQHDLTFHGRKSGPHAVGALSAAEDERTDVTASKRGLRLRFLAGADDDPHGADPRMAGERVDGMGQHGLAADRAKLLG